MTPRTANDRPSRSAAESAQLLEHALEQFESTLGKLEEHGGNSGREPRPRRDDDDGEFARSLRPLIRRIEDALEQLGRESRRLSDEAARLTLIAERLEARIDRPAAATPSGRGAAPEPRFPADGDPLQLVLAAVPGFQGLMDAQRALSGLAGVDGASVIAYRNGEASLELLLVEPLSAREIVEKLARALGSELLIEEARVDDLRLRLRFVD